MVALDCEMCQTMDPLTGEKDNGALIRISLINGLNPSEVLLDTLVLPAWPVSEMRSHIHGINKEQLHGVTFTLRHAQAALANLLTDRTILVGHGLSNDLKAMRLKHR